MTRPQNLFATDPTLGSLMDVSPVGLVVFDHDACVLYANNLAEQLFGKSADALIGSGCGDFIACHHRRSDPRGCGHVEHCPPCPFHQAIQAVLEGNTDPEMTKGETLVHRESGPPAIWSRFKAGGVVLDGRQAVVMALDDITERKRAEDALRESERHLQKVFDILPVGLWFADKDGTLLRGNPSGIKIWGAEPLVDPSRYGISRPDDFPPVKTLRPPTGRCIKRSGTSRRLWMNSWKLTLSTEKRKSYSTAPHRCSMRRGMFRGPSSSTRISLNASGRKPI